MSLQRAFKIYEEMKTKVRNGGSTTITLNLTDYNIFLKHFPCERRRGFVRYGKFRISCND